MLTREQNIFLAKKTFVELVYCHYIITNFFKKFFVSERTHGRDSIDAGNRPCVSLG